jgi:uncharacterized protein YbjT (DUF2867 family)
MTILVTGASGSVGRRVVQNLREQGATVRAMSRTPERLDLGVEVVGGDLSGPVDPRLFDGVDRIFLFPAWDGVAEFVRSAADAGVSRFVVLSSLAAAGENSRDVGSASNVHHLAVERAVAAVSEDWTFLRPGTFATNLIPWIHTLLAGNPLRLPYPGSSQPPVHEADVADLAALALTGSVGRGEAWPVTGPRNLTQQEQAVVLGAAIDRDVVVEQVTEQEFRDETGRWLPPGITDMLLTYWRETAGTPDLPHSAERFTGKPGRTLAEWAQDHRNEFVAG